MYCNKNSVFFFNLTEEEPLLRLPVVNKEAYVLRMPEVTKSRAHRLCFVPFLSDLITVLAVPLLC